MITRPGVNAIHDMYAFSPSTRNRLLEVQYLVDDSLHVRGVNDAWNQFAVDNNGANAVHANLEQPITHYFSGSARNKWSSIYQALLTGQLDAFRERVPCPSPAERRYYNLHIQRVETESGRVLDHRLIPADSESYKSAFSAALATLSQSDRQDRLFEATNVPELIGGICRTAVDSRPLEEVGGDLTYAAQSADGGTFIVIADMMGHGAAAATGALWMLTCLDRVTTEPVGSLGAFLEKVNSLFHDRPRAVDKDMYCTGLVFHLTPGSDRVTVANFGHSNPILSRSGAVEVPGGMPVGVLPEPPEWPEHTLALEDHGYEFLAYTDGIVEQFDENGTMFGVDRLVQVFERTLDMPPVEQVTAIQQEVDTFRGDAICKDDRSLLTIRHLGAN